MINQRLRILDEHSNGGAHRQLTWRLLAQSDDDRCVAGWTVDKFKNGALSALPPFAAKQLFTI
jgi:hypothetical protein